MKAEVVETGIILSDVDSPIAIEEFLKGIGFNAIKRFSSVEEEYLVYVYPPLADKETANATER